MNASPCNARVIKTRQFASEVTTMAYIKLVVLCKWAGYPSPFPYTFRCASKEEVDKTIKALGFEVLSWTTSVVN